MDEYEVKKIEPYNHFKRVFETARKLKDQRIIDRYKSRKIIENMPWYQKEKIQKLSRGNPFSDRNTNPNVLFSQI